MKNPFVRLLIVALLFGSIPAVIFLVAGLTAPEQIRSEHSTTVLAPPAKVWNVVTNWETMGSGMHKMMPKVGRRKVMGAPEPKAGVVVRYPLADGRNWDQRIVTWDPQRSYSFRNEQGTSAGMPGDVTMRFDLAPAQGGYTTVTYRIDVKADGFTNRALARVFGQMLGTLPGFSKAILETVKAAAEKQS